MPSALQLLHVVGLSYLSVFFLSGHVKEVSSSETEWNTYVLRHTMEKELNILFVFWISFLNISNA